MKKHLLTRSTLIMSSLQVLAGLFLLLVLGQPHLALARPVEQTTGGNVVKDLTKAFNAKDLNGCLALMTDDAMVTVVNPSDLATATLSKDTLTYKGKQGPQSQVANFFNINFTNGFTIWSTNFKSTATSFNGPMQLAIRNYVIETDVAATLEGGKIKTLVIIDKSISQNSNQPAPMPSNAPATGTGGESLTLPESQTFWGVLLAFAVSGTAGLAGLVVLRRRQNSR